MLPLCFIEPTPLDQAMLYISNSEYSHNPSHSDPVVVTLQQIASVTVPKTTAVSLALFLLQLALLHTAPEVTEKQ